MPLVIGVIKASLPSYFPDRHGVFEGCLARPAGRWPSRWTRGSSRRRTCRWTARAAQVATRPSARARGEFHPAAAWRLHHGRRGPANRRLGPTDGCLGDARAEPRRRHPAQQLRLAEHDHVDRARACAISRGDPVQWFFGAPDDPALRRASRADPARRLGASKRSAVRASAWSAAWRRPSTTWRSPKAGSRRAWASMSSIETCTSSSERMAACDRRRRCSRRTGQHGRRRRNSGRFRRADGPDGSRCPGVAAIAAKNGFDALAVSDWPALQENPGMHPGAAFTWLEEADNLPVASEGDVLGRRHPARRAGPDGPGRLPAGHDLPATGARPDIDVAWRRRPALHGAAETVLDQPSHDRPRHGRRARCFGAIADFEFAIGPATIVRIAKDGAAQFSVEADVVPGDEPGFDGCRGWLGNFVDRTGPASAADIVTTVHGARHRASFRAGARPLARDSDEFAAWAGMTPLGLVRRA